MEQSFFLEQTMRPELSGYRIMWMIIMFDLPVGSKKERKAANDFRTFLQDMGFDRAQFSIYYRVMGGKEVAERYIRRIEGRVPASGSVNILTITDKQYENMICFLGKEKNEPPPVQQLTLF